MTEWIEIADGKSTHSTPSRCPAARPNFATKRPAGVFRSSGLMFDISRSPTPGVASSPAVMPTSAGAEAIFCPVESYTNIFAATLSSTTNGLSLLSWDAITQLMTCQALADGSSGAAACSSAGAAASSCTLGTTATLCEGRRLVAFAPDGAVEAAVAPAGEALGWRD